MVLNQYEYVDREMMILLFYFLQKMDLDEWMIHLVWMEIFLMEMFHHHFLDENLLVQWIESIQ